MFKLYQQHHLAPSFKKLSAPGGSFLFLLQQEFIPVGAGEHLQWVLSLPLPASKHGALCKGEFVQTRVGVGIRERLRCYCRIKGVERERETPIVRVSQQGALATT